MVSAKIIFLFVFVTIIPMAFVAAADGCSADEVHDACSAHCEPTCESHDANRACTTICLPGCKCREELVRRKDRQCVPLEQCYAGGSRSERFFFFFQERCFLLGCSIRNGLLWAAHRVCVCCISIPFWEGVRGLDRVPAAETVSIRAPSSWGGLPSSFWGRLCNLVRASFFVTGRYPTPRPLAW
ncbi:IgGFc-binding protein-like [Cydia strobilella]|uniref:IgGFc-binding protein-like n=1 Tax=Cydia strobilella TaxID=1100964 RepID=UPI0030045A69